MKKSLIKASILGIAISISLFSCKKNEETLDESGTQQTTVADNNNAREGSEDVANDATNAVEADNGSQRTELGVNGKVKINVPKITCADSIVKNTDGSLVIYYNGNKTNIRGNKKTGSATIVKTGTWGEEGSSFTITFNDVKVTRPDGKSITLTGTKTITNVNGKKFKDIVLSNDSMVQNVSGNISLTFDDGTVRSWEITRKRVLTINNGLKIYGTGVNGIAESGQTRGGHIFNHRITSPITFKLCGAQVKQVSGSEVFNISSTNYPAGKDITLVSGVDANGVIVADECDATSVKLTWTNKKNVEKTAIVTVNK